MDSFSGCAGRSALCGDMETNEKLGRLLDYIASCQHVSLDGCPLVALWGFVRREGVGTDWLMLYLHALRKEGHLHMPKPCYYVVTRTRDGY